MRKSFTTALIAIVICLTSINMKAQPAITGDSTICSGGTVTLSDAVPGGTWSISDTTIATINDTTGALTALAAGTATITYTLDSGYVTRSITVNPTPSFTAPASICTNDTVTLTDTLTGITWASGDTTVAAIGALTGIIIPVAIDAADTVTITSIAATGCAATAVVTINPAPDPIANPPGGFLVYFLCIDEPYPIQIIDSTSGGSWTSSDSLLIAINGITGVAGPGAQFDSLFFAGIDTAIITYTLPSGCFVTKCVPVEYCESIATIPNANIISLYPNPATDQLTITSSAASITFVKITNLVGQTVYAKSSTTNNKELNIDVSPLPPGTYFVKVNDTWVQEFVKE